MKAQSMKNKSIIMGVAIALLAIFTLVNDAQAQRNSTTISSSRNGARTITHNSGSQRLNVEYDGDIEFADDDKSIKSISRGGYLFIRKTSFGKRREILAEPNSDGTVEYEYRVGRRKEEWGKEAEEFLADMLLEVIRTTGIGAESRVNRFYKEGGLDGVLKEISAIRGDYVSQIYLKVLLDEKDLNDNELEKLAAYVPRELDSDHYITEVFKDHSDKFFKNEKTTEAFLNAIDRMDSDHYVSIILKRAMKEDLSEAATIKVLSAAEIMDSDHYKTNVFQDLLKRRDLSDNLIDQIVKSAADIDSDHYATIVLKKALDRPNLSDKAFENLMDAVSNIDSDHYTTETFKSMLNSRQVSDKVVEAVMNKLEYMDSDHYRNVIINDLFDNQAISSKYFDNILNTVNDIGSDHYASQILIKVLKDQDLDSDAYAKVLSRVADIDSDHYKVNILKNVLKERNLKKDHLVSILKVADSIGSDYYKSEVLKGACNAVQDADDTVKSQFKRVAKGIRSDTYYGRVARCVD
ncbi:hypothetical protein [Roseivirga sp. E12]|uniref:hypothetical protein n=1 Tax=Roseivirga sp. E12 TaxID=2819237 RepID=UPI001ABC8106|nr:hypothetical protein [Roseivirga sp. E12]